MPLTAFLLGMCFVSNVLSAEPSIDLKALFRGGKQLIFVDSVPLDDGYAYQRVKITPLQGDQVDEALNQIIEKGKAVGDYPGIGFFTYMVLVDGEGSPLAVLDLLTFKGIVVISGCQRKGEYFDDKPLSPSMNRVFVASPAFAKIIYDWVAKENPGFLAERQKVYSELGLSFEGLLFEGDDTRTPKPKE